MEPTLTSTVVETAAETEEERKKHWESVKGNEERLREQRRLVERVLGRRSYPR